MMAKTIWFILLCFSFTSCLAFEIPPRLSTNSHNRLISKIKKSKQQQQEQQPTSPEIVAREWISSSSSFNNNEYEKSQPHDKRRLFLRSCLGTTLILPFLGERSFLAQVAEAKAATKAEESIVSQAIKVLPGSHTFIMKKGSAKPIRENDATRYLTNAKIVYLFVSGTNKDLDASTVDDIVRLTVQRKAEQGAGVTPGLVQLLSSSKDGDWSSKSIEAAANKLVSSSSTTSIADIVKKANEDIGTDDVLFVPPRLTEGTVADAKLVQDTAAMAGNIGYGGVKGGGVVSVLLNGPQYPDTLNVIEYGFETSLLIWFGS